MDFRDRNVEMEIINKFSKEFYKDFFEDIHISLTRSLLRGSVLNYSGFFPQFLQCISPKKTNRNSEMLT